MTSSIILRGMQKIKREFTIKYNEIISSDIGESEKKQQIQEILEVANAKVKEIADLRNSEEELSSELKDFLELDAEIEIDEKLLDVLVEVYVNKAKEMDSAENNDNMDIAKFEEEIRKYFTEHYSELFNVRYNHFLEDFEENKDFIDIANQCGIDYTKFKYFGHEFTIQNGLIAIEDAVLGRTDIIYSTPEGINERISNLYNEAIFNQATLRDADSARKMKSAYLTYAEEQGIEVENRNALEEIEVDPVKVDAIARYINKILSKRSDVSQKDNVALFAEEITKKYSKIMNLKRYGFAELESVKNIVGVNAWYMFVLSLDISDESIMCNDDLGIEVVWATPEYLKREYTQIMDKVHNLHETNSLVKENELDINSVSSKKLAFRKYIVENGVEGIDTQVPQVEIDYGKLNMIVDTLVERYGSEQEDKSVTKARFLSIMESKYAEIITEQQCVYVSDIVGKIDPVDMLYMRDDFAYVGDYTHRNGKCIYATQEAAQDVVSALEMKIEGKTFCEDEKRIIETLVKYADENGIELHIKETKSDVAQRRSLPALKKELDEEKAREEKARHLLGEYEHNNPSKSQTEDREGK